ncbi:MAG: glycosyltransferase family 2 protein [Steroidobacteraceae bacterium]
MQHDPPRSAGPTLSLVVPAYNEQEVLPEFHRRATAALQSLGLTYEIVYVNDGSADATMPVLRGIQAQDSCAVVVSLSRNFGKEIALTAGLDHARGEAVVVIDADLQDPPELIGRLVERWREGHDVVYARRVRRDGETWLKRLTAHAFYRVMGGMSRVRIPEDTGDFRLLSRRAVDAVRSLREQHRFMKGLFAWVGYSQVAVDYERDPRAAGQTKWNYWKLWNFALEGITSFTIAPLKLATYVGLAIALTAFAFAGAIIFKTLMYGDPVRGFPTLMVTVLFMGGVQLLFIGVIGEYLGRIFNEAKGRPLYFVGELLQTDADAATDAERPVGPRGVRAGGRHGNAATPVSPR